MVRGISQGYLIVQPFSMLTGLIPFFRVGNGVRRRPGDRPLFHAPRSALWRPGVLCREQLVNTPGWHQPHRYPCRRRSGDEISPHQQLLLSPLLAVPGGRPPSEHLHHGIRPAQGVLRRLLDSSVLNVWTTTGQGKLFHARRTAHAGEWDVIRQSRRPGCENG